MCTELCLKISTSWLIRYLHFFLKEKREEEEEEEDDDDDDDDDEDEHITSSVSFEVTKKEDHAH